MKLIQKLTKNKNEKNIMEFLDECLLNEEAMPSKQSVSEEMKNHPEGEYVVKEDGIYLSYVMREDKSRKDLAKDDNNEINV